MSLRVRIAAPRHGLKSLLSTCVSRQGRSSSNVTSQILDEILQFHLPLCFHVGAVHVRVEEDDGEGQDEDGVGVLELSHQRGIAHAVSLTAGETKAGEELHPKTTKIGSIIIDLVDHLFLKNTPT